MGLKTQVLPFSVD